VASEEGKTKASTHLTKRERTAQVGLGGWCGSEAAFRLCLPE